MYIGYFDEFGHNGHYIGRYDKAHKTHPVFGLGGFVVPSDNVRELSREFRKLKEQTLKTEINAKVITQGKNLSHWEKKGSALLTTQNVQRYQEVRTLMSRVFALLERLDAKVYFYGQEKPRGGPGVVSESNKDRYDHTMKQLIQRIDRDLPANAQMLMLLDKQGDRERLEVFAGAAAFMFTHKSGARLVEPPMEVESHLYQTVQCADWICALLGRIAAYKYDPDFDEFQWSTKYFGDRLLKLTSSGSKIRAASSGKDVHPKNLGDAATCFDDTAIPASAAALASLANRYAG